MSNQSSASNDKQFTVQDIIHEIETKSEGAVISIAVNINAMKGIHTIEKFLQIFGVNTVLRKHTLI